MAWIDKIKNAISDTTKLDVVTTTGHIEFTSKEMAEINWEGIAEAVSAKIKEINISVVAYTRSEWDCDTFMFVKASLLDEEQKLLESHAAVVDAAHATRREAVKMLAGLIKTTVD